MPSWEWEEREVAARRMRVGCLMLDGRPRTARDVAHKLGMSEGEARAALVRLTKRGGLVRKQVEHCPYWIAAGAAKETPEQQA